MYYKDNFEDAISRVAYAHSIVNNAGYPLSERDEMLARRLKELISESKIWYHSDNKLKEK